MGGYPTTDKIIAICVEQLQTAAVMSHLEPMELLAAFEHHMSQAVEVLDFCQPGANR
jgi:hypothetical protein